MLCTSTFYLYCQEMSPKSDVLLQMYAKAPAPLRDYYGITISNDHVITNQYFTSIYINLHCRFSLGDLEHLEHFARPPCLSKEIQEGHF